MDEKQSEVNGVFDIECLCQCIGQTIYKKGKAQIFNVIEAVMPNNDQLYAIKRVIENVLTYITKDVADELRSFLDGWEIEVTGGGELSPEEEDQARKDYQEIEEIIR